MLISDLPAEVLEKIFQCLDGRTFCLAKQVNKNWYNILKHMQKNQTLWETFCMKEINSSIIDDMLPFNYKSQERILNWSDVYQKWYQGRLILQKSYTVTEIPVPACHPVTCIRVSGSWIITGHSNGNLCIWIKEKLYQKCLFHLKTIADIALVDLLNINCYYGSEENDQWSHHHIITVSEDECIRATSLLESLRDCNYSPKADVHFIHKHRDALYSVRVFGNQFAVAARDNTVSVWVMEVVKEPFFRLKISFLKFIKGPDDYLDTLGLWNSKVYFITQTTKLFALENLEWKEKPYFKNKLISHFGEGLIITAYYAFRDEVFIMFSEDGKMMVSLPGESSATYSVLKDLRTPVMSVALSGTILALGLGNGKLCLYHVPTNESLLRLDLSRPDFCELLGGTPIVSVHMEYHRSFLVVVASTTETMFFVRWYRSEAQKLSLTAAVA